MNSDAINKQFVVYDNNGDERIAHQSNVYCIHRKSLFGSKLLTDIRELKKNNWSYLNKECSNPVCVLASDEAYAQYIKNHPEEDPDTDCEYKSESDYDVFSDQSEKTNPGSDTEIEESD